MLQVHGFPKVMGVLTHLDQFRNADALKRTKKDAQAPLLGRDLPRQVPLHCHNGRARQNVGAC